MNCNIFIGMGIMCLSNAFLINAGLINITSGQQVIAAILFFIAAGFAGFINNLDS